MMPSTFSSVPSLWLRITLLVLSFFALHCQGAPVTGPDEYACKVCRESPEGERVLINPSKIFTQSSGRKTTCGELQEWVQDVQPSGGSPGEAELCGLTQYLAWFYLCDCEGPDIPSPIDNVKDPNPSCDICGAPGLDFDFIPEPNRKKLTDTVFFGRQNCDGLYLAAAEGIFSSTHCPMVQQKSGPECCNLGIVTGPPVAVSPSNIPTTKPPIDAPSTTPTEEPTPTDAPSTTPTEEPTPTDAPSTTPTEEPTPDICSNREKKKPCIKTFGCSWKRKNRKSQGICETAFETAQCSGKKRSRCIRKGCVWRTSDESCLGRWS